MSNKNKEFEFKQKWFDFMKYKPHAGQKKLHFPEKAGASYFVNICGRRYGKTTAAFREAEFYAAQPDKKIWLVGLSYKKSRLMFMVIISTIIQLLRSSISYNFITKNIL